jgi:hypothetical protein
MPGTGLPRAHGLGAFGPVGPRAASEAREFSAVYALKLDWLGRPARGIHESFELADRRDMRVVLVDQHIDTPPPKLIPELLRQVRALRAQGLTWAKVALRLNVPATSARKWHSAEKWAGTASPAEKPHLNTKSDRCPPRFIESPCRGGEARLPSQRFVGYQAHHIAP